MGRAGPVMLSASEVEKFAYCPLNWWLARKGGEAAEREGKEHLDRGAGEHRVFAEKLGHIRSHQEKVRHLEMIILVWSFAATIISILGVFMFMTDILVSRMVIVIALIWLLAALYFLYRSMLVGGETRREYETAFAILAIFATMASIYAVEFVLPPDEVLGRALEASALVWLIGAVLALYRSLLHEHQASVKKRSVGMNTAAALDYIDAPGGTSETLVSRRYGLRGRPDAVLREGEAVIPLERKTGRVPRGPLFSHIAQVCVYCIILEERWGPRVERGVVQYGDVKFDIEYSEDLKQTVLGMAGRMRAALSSDEDPPVHRNHNRPRKCAGCSRRGLCSERLV